MRLRVAEVAIKNYDNCRGKQADSSGAAQGAIATLAHIESPQPRTYIGAINTDLPEETRMDPVCAIPGASLTIAPSALPDPALDSVVTSEGAQTAVLAGGCFWCVEGVFKQLDGVLEVTSGYSGDSADKADYKAVCSGRTNHAEAVSIRFDPARISYGQLLKVFFAVAHDPTQKDGQGADIGRQYRSAIIYVDEIQHKIADAYIAQLDAARVFVAPIVTEVVPLDEFHVGEAYHQNYAELNPEQGYIAAVAQPKIEKVRRYFADKLQSGGQP